MVIIATPPWLGGFLAARRRPSDRPRPVRHYGARRGRRNPAGVPPDKDQPVTETTSKFRRLSGAACCVERALLLALTLISATWATQVHPHLPWAFFNEQFLGAFLGLALASVFVAVKGH